MKKFCILLMLIAPVFQAVGRDGPEEARVGMVSQRIGAAQGRAAGTASKNQLSAPSISVSTNHYQPTIKDDGVKPALPAESGVKPQPEKPDMREEERMLCLNNNVGIGNTFVWASRFSNTNSYASMQEDTKNPENNVCFVKVDLRSVDGAVDLSSFPSKYFQWGQNVTCGSWVNEKDLEERILDAKKQGRVLATVGGALGGAAVGVGAMELFGNKLIGGKVEGQKNKKLSDTEKLRSQLLVLKKENVSRFNSLMADVRKLKEFCDKTKDKASTGVCNLDYDVLLAL